MEACGAHYPEVHRPKLHIFMQLKNILVRWIEITVKREKMNENGIKCIPFGKQLVRMVTHLDFTDNDLEYLHHVLSS